MICTQYNGYDIEITREITSCYPNDYATAKYRIRVDGSTHTELWTGPRTAALLLKSEYINFIPFQAYVKLFPEEVHDELAHFDDRFLRK